jgi:uncharacterized membrane protein YfcA
VRTVTAVALLSLGLFAVVVGVFIGCIGIGGVLLVPTLVYLGGIDIRTAIAAAMFSYLITGLIGAVIFARHGSIRWSMALWLCAGAMPAAFAGSWASNVINAAVLELIIAALILLAGIRALRPQGQAEAGEAGFARPLLVGTGAVTGFGSALSGTGGPLVLVPLLIWLEVPILTAIGLSQAIQLPIAALATAGNLVYGRLDLVLGASIAAGLALGSAFGAQLAHRLPLGGLRRIVAVVLVLVGIWLLGQIVWRQLGA